MVNLSVILVAVIVGTWNGNWFPSGRAEHRAPSAVEEATSFAAAKMLAAGLKEADPAGTNDVILCLNEIRGPKAASNLVARIGRKGLRVVVISGYRRRDRFDQQQDVIATTLPVAEAQWSRWKGKGKVFPPRGYAFAAVVLNPATTAAVYAVHLKSNYRATTPALWQENVEKRTVAIAQLLSMEKAKRGRGRRPVLIVGDMNADRWRKEFSSERLFGLLEEAGFQNPLERLPAAARYTHPSATYGNSALDYVFYRGFEARALPMTIPAKGLSDHRALFVPLATETGF